MKMNESKNENAPVPTHLLRIIPTKGQYLKSIMELTGYNDVDSVSRLKDPKELQGMFDFAADLFDGVDNKEEVYGHFSKNPKCLRILPGIADAFKTFLEEVNKMKPTDQSLVNPSKRKS